MDAARTRPRARRRGTSYAGVTFETASVPACLDGGALPTEDEPCFVMLVDDGTPAKATDDPDDDMSDRCVDEGWNLEFDLVQRTGVPLPPRARLEASCQLSTNRAIDCPLLP